MNDRFKFRGYWYNDVFKEWRVIDEPDFITGDGSARIYYQGEAGAEDEVPDNVELHLCQCTGLKDKNGKLIYEGDIVKDALMNRFTITFNEEYLSYLLTNIKTNEQMVFYPNIKLEVIGNIYENKELLESEG